MTNEEPFEGKQVHEDNQIILIHIVFFMGSIVSASMIFDYPNMTPQILWWIKTLILAWVVCNLFYFSPNIARWMRHKLSVKSK